jgi:hypothetical protein
VLSLFAALTLSAAPELPRRLYDDTHTGRWLDAADAWVRERGELTPEAAAPEWMTRGALSLALELDHPDLARAMRPLPIEIVDSDSLDRRSLIVMLRLASDDPLDRWNAGIETLGGLHDFARSYQACACVATLLRGAAGRLVASTCEKPTTQFTPGDERAAKLLAPLALPAVAELLPVPTGATPFERRPRVNLAPAPTPIAPRSLRLPGDYAVVHAERSGARIAVLATSSQLDPLNRSWWLLLGGNGSWDEYYLGLHALEPVTITVSGSVPLLGDDAIVRLEASDRPSAEGPRREFLLEAPLAELTRDTDHDGLTDVLEDRLRLDPKLVDSDWDGLADAEDPSPRFHQRAGVAALLAVAFERRGRWREDQRAFGPQGYVFAPPPALAPTVANSACKHFMTQPWPEVRASGFYGTGRLRERVRVAVDDTGDHAFIEFSGAWYTTGFRIDRAADGTITMVEVSGWVS